MVQAEDLDCAISADLPLSKSFIDKITLIKEIVGLWKVKLFTPEGIIVYSTDPADIGHSTTKDFFPQMFASGNPRSLLVEKSFQTDGASTTKMWLLETYIPLMSDGHAMGAFEIYFDVSDIHDSIHSLNKTAEKILITIVIGLLAGILITTYWAKKSMLELELSEDKYKKMSVTDSLTGLLNRRGFINQAEKHLIIANRGNKYSFLVFVDIDSFKNTNDKFGHDAGDKALIAVAGILKNTFRESDIIGRLGGDEFAVLTTQHSNLDSESSIRARLSENVSLWNMKERSDSGISLSIGVPTYIPNTECSLDHLLFKADKLMYESKNRNRFQPPDGTDRDNIDIS
ncbi:MAG: GGDEF domain-containing protein [Nitrospirota bacterium]